ncbi:hypothetical protein PF005_g9264 [Phytophthora fragariae]|uniref:RxLR effector protein n=1 Tax=Phytophthora fragariae TaxID=53985 RepID=A0A6A3K3L3_9STRA|nr:hypothetical protein PF003_g25130 [Phytophthora fragariae]KAE8945886.1 hypothetical protein PF009_g4476 [Phytophthora fragariae]KAE9000197.1 hypothetical protein PF011_g14299 [Phytophthora fragariae]KAE9098916.1 hypothetical protein PF007_g16086 [Phytophthora fragariae]KAE9121772.1 hypothetical protein PF010_g6971 [Phytophthora fragariae]
MARIDLKKMYLKKMLDYKKFFGMRDVPKEFANGVVNEFSRATINEMLKNKKFRFAVFKKWDNVNIDELAMKVGEATPHNKRVGRMFVDYRYHHRNYKWSVGR